MRGLVIAIAAIGAIASPARAQETNAVVVTLESSLPTAVAPGTADFEACIRENVSRVEAATDSLEDGTAFLTTRLCAPLVAEAIRAERRKMQEAQAARFRTECENGQRGGLAGFLSGYDPCDVADNLAQWGDYPIGDVAAQVPAEMTGLAAELLLQARLARRAAEAQ